MNLKDTIENKTYDEERALYNLKDAEVRNCTFAPMTYLFELN